MGFLGGFMGAISAVRDFGSRVACVCFYVTILFW